MDKQTLWTKARLLQTQGKFAEAQEAYEELGRLHPTSFAVQYNLGLVRQELGDTTGATNAYQRALVLNPALAEAHNNLANLYRERRDPEAAIQHYRDAIRLNGGLAAAYENLALIELELGRYPDAARNFAQLVELVPTNDTAWSKLFALLFSMREKRLAISLFPKWARQKSTLNQVTAGLVVARLTGNVSAEMNCLRSLSDFDFGAYTAAQMVAVLGNLQYFDVDPEVMLAMYKRMDRAYSDIAAARPSPNRQRQPGRMRIGYLSADFRTHVMGRIMLELVRCHDRQSVDVALFSTCPEKFHDQTTSEFRGAAHFEDLATLPDDEAARVIAGHDLDILVDLIGHTLENRPGILARKPARVVATHLGYHGCIGLSAVDYKITDRIVDTPESVLFQLEKPLWLDTCVMPFAHIEPHTDAASREQLRHDAGLTGSVAIGCFVNPIKLSPRCLSAWRTVLERAPNTKLVLSLVDAKDNELVVEQLKSHGIDPARLAFLPTHTDERRMRARYAAIDMVLDTFPYAGGDTTVAALDMDVPVVTLKGNTHASRMGYSILAHLGLTDTVADTLEHYVEIALTLARSPERRAQMVARIREAKANSPSSRIENHARSLERAYFSATGLRPNSDFAAAETAQ